MLRTSPTTRRTGPTLLAAVVLVAGGCAGLPRIDPSGERLLVFPNNAPAVTAPGLPAPAGNLAAPPVVGSGTSSVCPLCPFGSCGLGDCGLGDCGLGDGCRDAFGALGSLCPLDGSCCDCDLFGNRSPTVPPPGPAVAAPLAAAATRTVLPDADETLSITPERILAPVGSEVVLKAGVCANDGYLRTNRRIEWTLGGEGAGQFVNIGERGELDILRYPWQRPQKVDNHYAVGYTPPFHTCLDRGTSDPTDDTQIRPGEAWVTVTSASEGASYVTAYAPESRHWEARRSTATIYWVDARWQYPPDAVVQLGQTHTLTTTVTRESDGAPVAGYVVRYEALGGAAAQLGYEGGQVAEAVTDAQGRASIQITPTDDQPGTVRVGVKVVRPAQSAPMPSPELELGAGETSVTWSPTAAPAPFLPGDPSTPTTTIPPVPFEPAPDDRPTPPPASLGAPQLEVTLRRDTVGPVRVNDTIPVTITVRNAGDAPATGIELRDAFDRGLTNAGDIDGEFEIKYPSFPDLAPGESEAVPLEFTAITAGRQCHRVTVTAPGAQPAVERQCFEVESPAPPPAPELRVDAEGELQREVGQPYRFRARVTNNGAVTAEGYSVEIWHDSDATLRPSLATEGNVALERGFRWTLPPLAPGESRRFEVEYECRSPAPEAKVTVFVEGPGIETVTETRAVEIVASRAGAAPPLAPPTASPLRASISSTANPAQVGRPAALNLLIENTGAQTLRDVDFRLTFPPQVRPTLSPTTSPLPFRVNQNTLQFDPVPELRPGEPIRLTVPYEALSQGEVRVILEARSADLQGLQSAEAPISIRAR